MQSTKKYILFVALLAVFTGCRWVDEDLSDCETTYNINYEMRLVTNMTAELQTQLSMAADVEVATALENYLKDVFTDFAHDVDLSFYDVFGDSLRLHHESHIMDANQSSYTLYIPVRKYMHVAIANLEDNPEVVLEQDGNCHRACLVQPVRKVVESQSTGVFSARLPMDIRDGVDQQFDVSLYMVNSASALVLDTLDSHIKDLKVYASGFATSFNLADSTYRFSYEPHVRALDIYTGGVPGTPACFAAVTFPSPDLPDTKSQIETNDPFVSAPADHSLWYYSVYATLPDGSVTETVLGVRLPLRPGQVKLIKAKVVTDGSVVPHVTADPYVGASVTLQWNDRPSWEVDV